MVSRDSTNEKEYEMDAIANLAVTAFGSVVTVTNPCFEERRITNRRA